MLTQILQPRRLDNKPVNLPHNIHLDRVPKVPAGKLLLHPVQHLKRPRVLHLHHIRVPVGADADAVDAAGVEERRVGTGARAGGGRAGGLDVCLGGEEVLGSPFEDGGAAAAGDVRAGDGGLALGLEGARGVLRGGQAPGEKRVVDELFPSQ